MQSWSCACGAVGTGPGASMVTAAVVMSARSLNLPIPLAPAKLSDFGPLTLSVQLTTLGQRPPGPRSKHAKEQR